MKSFFNKFSNYSKIVIFLLLEILAVFSFSLGNSFIFNLILSSVIFVLIVLVSIKELNSDGYITGVFFVFPILMFGIISALSSCTFSSGFPLGDLKFIICIPLVFFAASGYLVSYLKDFNISKAIFIIYSALALYVFINFIINMIQFEPFYTINYSSYHFYYGGQEVRNNVGRTAYVLYGFNFELVSIDYYFFFPGLLCTSFIYLLFNKFKDNKLIYLAYASYGGLGLFNYVLFPSKFPLVGLSLLFVTCLILVLLNKLKVNKSIVKIVFIIITILGAIGFILFFLNAQGSKGVGKSFTSINDLFKSNALFNRLFNNRYASTLDGIAVIQDGRIYGYFLDFSCQPTNSLFFDSFIVLGTFGVVFLIVIFIFGIRSMFKYYKISQDSLSTKVMIFGFVFGFVALSLLCYDQMPFAYSDLLTPIYISSLFMIVLFLMGYCNGKANATLKESEEKKNEEVVID